jgi:predicted PurR-regulated permease PerM
MSQLTRGSHDSTRGHIVFTFALALALYMAWLIRHELALLYVSGLFAVVLSPVVRATQRLRFGRWLPFKGSAAVFILILVIAGAIAGFCVVAFPPIIRDMQAFTGEMPNRVPGLLDKLQHLPIVNRLETDNVVSKLQDWASTGARYVLASASSWASGLARILIGFVLMLYFVLEGEQAYHWFLSFFPAVRRERLDSTLRRAAERMGKWLLGQATLMAILGITSMIVFLSLGLRYAYALGVLTGMLNIVPVLGVTVSLVIALLVGAIDSWGRVLGVAIFFGVYVSIENYFLVPQIMKSRLNLPALAIFIALLLGAAIDGIPGAMVAIPTAVLVSVLLDEYVVRKEAA